MLNLKKKLKYKNLIDENNFLDEKYYLKKYQDARLSKFTAIEHFCKVGLEKGYKPNELFDPIWYAKYYADVKNSSLLPVIYFLTLGKKKNHFQNKEEMVYYTLIKKSGLFDSEFYASYDENLKIKEDNVDLLLDYVRYGEKAGKRPNMSFDATQYYNEHKNEIVKLNVSAFEHYMLYHDEIDILVAKAKKNMATPFKKK